MKEFGTLLGALASGGGAQPIHRPGPVLRRCPLEAACTFAQPDMQVAGMMPRGWSVEVMTRQIDTSVATWFTDRDAAGNEKRIGLNQAGGEGCTETRIGTLCAFTPYIATQEMELIARSLRRGTEADVISDLSGAVDALRPVKDPAALDALLNQLEGK
jgi:hypothetical protein